MSRLPFTLEIRPEFFGTSNLQNLAKRPYCFFLDSASSDGKSGRYSFFGVDPVKIFWSCGGFVTVDAHTFIDDPILSMRRFEKIIAELPHDPYLPFHGGMVGFVGHSWAIRAYAENTMIPDAWFGLYDTVITFDHLEGSCWISSMGITPEGTIDAELAQRKCEELAEEIGAKIPSEEKRYLIKPNLPAPVSCFDEGRFVNAYESAQKSINKKEWDSVTIAQRFQAPVVKTGWSIHDLLRTKNPTPYAGFLKCGQFELLSTSSSCFLNIEDNKVTCNVIQRSLKREKNETQDRLNQMELLYDSREKNPIVVDEENSLTKVLEAKPKVSPSFIISDARSHFLLNKIQGKKKRGASMTNLLASALPGATMTGVPKISVNEWIRRTEPVRRDVYTGAIGCIGTGGNAQFNMAVRTMMIKDQTAYVHSGSQVLRGSSAEEKFHNTRSQVTELFEDIKALGE